MSAFALPRPQPPRVPVTVPVSTERLVPLAPAPGIDVVWEDGHVVRLRAQGRELVREP